MSPRPQRPSYFRTLSSSAQKHKPRLYIALYSRGSSNGATFLCDAYHWALMIGPPTSSRSADVTRYHLVHPTNDTFMSCTNTAAYPSYLEVDNLQDSLNARQVLVRIAVAKVVDVTYVHKVLRSLDPRVRGDDHTCFTWVREAFAALHEETGCLKSWFDGEDWMYVERVAREFVKQKRREGRFAGRNSSEICTFNAWEKRETTP